MRLEKLRDLYKMPWASERELSEKAWEDSQEKIIKYKLKMKIWKQ